MNSVTLTTESGYTWTTSINATHDEAKAYFLGNYFPIGSFDEDAPNEGFTQEKVVKMVYHTTTTLQGVDVELDKVSYEIPEFEGTRAQLAAL